MRSRSALKTSLLLSSRKDRENRRPKRFSMFTFKDKEYQCPENNLTLKVLNELQSSYDELLHKYAAAENALDKVSCALSIQNQLHHFAEKGSIS